MKRMHAVGFARPISRTVHEELADWIEIERAKDLIDARCVTISYDPHIAWGYHAAFVVNRAKAYVSLFAEA